MDSGKWYFLLQNTYIIRVGVRSVLGDTNSIVEGNSKDIGLSDKGFGDVELIVSELVIGRSNDCPVQSNTCQSVQTLTVQEGMGELLVQVECLLECPGIVNNLSHRFPSERVE